MHAAKCKPPALSPSEHILNAYNFVVLFTQLPFPGGQIYSWKRRISGARRKTTAVADAIADGVAG